MLPASLSNVIMLHSGPKINTHQATIVSKNLHWRVYEAVSITNLPVKFLCILAMQCCENMNINELEQRSGTRTLCGKSSVCKHPKCAQKATSQTACEY